MTIRVNFVYKHDECFIISNDLKKILQSNTIRDSNKNQYNVCAAKGCNKPGIHFLSASYIHKIGLFCDSCRIELEEYGLVDSSYESNFLKKNVSERGQLENEI